MATIAGRLDPNPNSGGSGSQSICNCGYRTKRLSNLSRHIETMHGVKHNKNFVCCGKLYPTKSIYKDHRLEAHMNGYKCPQCLKVFSRRALLHRHSSVHTGIRDFHCNFCDYESSHKSNLERHIKTRHINPNPKVKTSTHRSRHFLGPPQTVPDSTSTGYSNSIYQQSQRPKNSTIIHSIASILTRPMKSKKIIEISKDNEVSSTTTTTATAFPGYPGTSGDNGYNPHEHVWSVARSDFPQNKPYHHNSTLKDVHMGQDLRFHMTATARDYYPLTLNHTSNLFTPYYYGYYDNNVGQEKAHAIPNCPENMRVPFPFPDESNQKPACVFIKITIDSSPAYLLLLRKSDESMSNQLTFSSYLPTKLKVRD